MDSTIDRTTDCQTNKHTE